MAKFDASWPCAVLKDYPSEGEPIVWKIYRNWEDACNHYDVCGERVEQPHKEVRVVLHGKFYSGASFTVETEGLTDEEREEIAVRMTYYVKPLKKKRK